MSKIVSSNQGGVTAMANKLRFDLQLVEHPYSDETDAHLEAWGELSLSLLLDPTLSLPVDWQPQIPLLTTQWDLSEVAEWFAHNLDSLFTNDLPGSDGSDTVLPQESLAQALRRLADREFTEEDEEAQYQWAEALYLYHSHHALRFAMRGARVPDIIIGCNHGTGEISLGRQEDDDDLIEGDWSFLGSWGYPFDTDDFRTDVRHKLRQLMMVWAAATPHADARERAATILNRL